MIEDRDRELFEKAWYEQQGQPDSYMMSHEEKGLAWSWYSLGFGDGNGGNVRMLEALSAVASTENCGGQVGAYRQCLTTKCCVCCWETAQLATDVLAELAQT